MFSNIDSSQRKPPPNLNKQSGGNISSSPGQAVLLPKIKYDGGKYLMLVHILPQAEKAGNEKMLTEHPTA